MTQVLRFAPGFALLGFMAVIMPAAQARLFRMPEPEQIAAQANVICNSLVLSITENTTPNGANPWNGVVSYIARINILHVFKGTAATEIQLRYTNQYGLPNGPINIGLAEHKRFRFFLKESEPAGVYVGALNGQMDDGFAVERIADNEADDHPYTSKEEATKLLQQYLKVTHPDLHVDFTTNRDSLSEPIGPSSVRTHG